MNALLERRAPVLLRLAMLFALTDLRFEIDVHHIDAALAWVRYWADSVKFVFASELDEVGAAQTNDAAAKIVEYLGSKGKATRKQLTLECFQGHATKTQIDAAIDELLSATPPRVVVETVPRPKATPGAATKFYTLAANCAKSANSEHWRGLAQSSHVGEPSEPSEPPDTSVRTVRTVSELPNRPATRASVEGSHSSHRSQSQAESEVSQ